MTANRKADLQRKLTLAAIPKPPVGLAERIKTDIPKHLPTSTELDRKRLSSAVAFNMRVAASVLLLVGSLFFALHLLNRAYEEQDQKYAAFNDALKNDKAPSASISPFKPQRQAPQVVTSTEQPPAVIAPPRPQLKQQQAPVVVADGSSSTESRFRRDEREKDANIATDAKKEDEEKQKLRTLGYVNGRVAESASPAGAPAPAAPAVDVAPSPVAPPPPPPAMAKTARATPATNGFLLDGLQAAEVAFEPATVFGYAMKSRALDTAAPLVQHFAGPESRPSHGVQLETDAAPSAFADGKNVVRISIDTAAKSVGDDATPGPVAADATLDITFDPSAVVSSRAVTGELSTSERMLVEGTSVTAVYELELKPSLSPRAHVAKVRLRYRSVPDGRARTIERNLRVRDLASSFDKASPRLKRAALAAALGEARAHGSDTSAIAEKAKALGLSELAGLASR